MYKVYLGGILLPCAPGKIVRTLPGRCDYMNFYDNKEFILRASANTLYRFEFTALIPKSKLSFAVYENGFVAPAFFMKKFEQLKRAGQPVPFVVTCRNPDRRGTSLPVIIESVSAVEDASYDSEVFLRFSLTEYRKPKKSAVLSAISSSYASENRNGRADAKAHIVVKGDCLYDIAAFYLSAGGRFTEIYFANKALIDGKNAGTGNHKYTIYPGQRLIIPER